MYYLSQNRHACEQPVSPSHANIHVTESKAICMHTLQIPVPTGGNNALIQLGEAKGKHIRLKGLKSFLAWRSAYLTRLGSIQNRLYVMMNWTTTFLFGRDMSKW